MEYNIIGTRIKQIRESKNMSIRELANRSGLSDSYVGRIENGLRRDPSITTISKIAKTLCVSEEVILRDNLDKRLNLSTKGLLDLEIVVDNKILDEEDKKKIYNLLVSCIK